MDDVARSEAVMDAVRHGPGRANAAARAVAVVENGRGSRLGWYWRRLSCMSATEVGYRFTRLALSGCQRVGLLTAVHPPQPMLGIGGAVFVNRDAQVEPSRYIRSAERVLKGELPLFSMCTFGYGAPSDWNRDPLTGVCAPMGFGKGIDYRSGQTVGNIKYLWEPNRHLHLVTLAQAYVLTGDDRYADGICDQIESWLDGCPYLRGPNWTSSLELGIRLINWSITWQLIGGLSSELFSSEERRHLRDRWLASVYQHCHFINGHLSRHSSANNHLIGEAAGLAVAGLTWPYWAESLAWVDGGRRILEIEAQLQNAPDGVNREQAVGYQTFVFDLLLLAGLAGEASGRSFSEAYWNRVGAMAAFVAALMDKDGHVPMIGDADDARATGLEPDAGSCPFQGMLATAGRVFGLDDLSHLGARAEDKCAWLLGVAPTRADSRQKAGSGTRRLFPDGGYYVLGVSRGASDEIHVVVDAGPVGYRSIAAHGHADALSMTLNVGGREFLVDPGTYAYHTEREWRDYFRGTSAHNTVRIDGLDQSVSGGSFMWSTTAQAFCERYDEDDDEQMFVGRHDGYLRLPSPVLHRRRVRLDKRERTISVTDSLLCEGEHEVEGFWHFAEACVIRCEGNRARVWNGDMEIVMMLPGGVEMELITGDETEPLGWISRQFGIRNPIPTLRWRRRVFGPAAFVTTITCAGR